MNTINQFEISAKQVSENLMEISRDDKKFSIDFCIACERYSRQIQLMINEIQEFMEFSKG